MMHIARVAAAWIALLAIIAIAAVISQLWDERERRKVNAAREKAKEQITRGFPTPLKNRALEAANRTAKPK
jgi:hypothetical protein